MRALLHSHHIKHSHVAHLCKHTGELADQNIKDRYYGINDPVANKMMRKLGEMPSLEPPEDMSIATL